MTKIISKYFEALKSKQFWKVYGVQLLFLIVFVALILSFSPLFAQTITQMKIVSEDFQSTIPVIDTTDPTIEDLQHVSENLEDTSALKKGIFDFLGVAVAFLGSFAIISALLYSFQLSLFQRKKVSFIRSFLFFGIVLFCIIAFGVFYFFIMSVIVAKLGYFNSNLILVILFWFFVILMSYVLCLAFQFYVYKRQIALKKTLLIHTILLVFLAIIILLMKWLIEWSYDFDNVFKILSIFIILLLILIFFGLIAFEKWYLSNS